MAGSINQVPERYGFLFTGVGPAKGAWPPWLLEIRHATLDYEQALVKCMPDYAFVAGVSFSGPSTGLLMLRLLHALRGPEGGRRTLLSGLLALARRRRRIWLVGFDAGAGPGFWVGHNWRYEQNWIESHRDRDSGTAKPRASSVRRMKL